MRIKNSRKIYCIPKPKGMHYKTYTTLITNIHYLGEVREENLEIIMSRLFKEEILF